MMKTLPHSFLFRSVVLMFSVILLGGFSAEAQLSKYCRTKQTVPSNGKYIYKNSAPLRSGGPGGTLIGFRREPTLIMNRNVSKRRSAKILNRRGKQIGSCPWASAIGHAGGRFRCTMQTASLRRKAIKTSGSAQIYFVVNSSKKLCAKITDAGRCYGSVKGLCNQLIK